MLDEMQKEAFTQSVNSEFQVIRDGSRAFDLKLTEVVDVFESGRQQAFSVFFQGPLEHFMQQGTYKLRHPELGEFEIFLVPSAQTKDGFQYEAAFNRLSPEKKSSIQG